MFPFSSQTPKPRPVQFRVEGKSLIWWLGFVAGVPLLLEAAILLVTGNIERFLFLFSQSAPGLIVIWPVSAPLLIWLYFGWNSCLERDELGSLRLLWLTPLVVLPITMLFWGALFYNPDLYSGIYERWQLKTVQLMFYSGIPLAILAIFFNRGRQSFVVPFSLLSIFNIFICAFTASSAVSGEWS